MNRYETLIVGSTMLLLLIGIYAVYSASGPIAYLQHNGDVGYFFRRQVMALGIGIAGFLTLWRLNYNVIIELSPVLFGVNIVMLVALFGFGTGRCGVNRWLPLGNGLYIQPSLITLVTVPLFISYIRKKNRSNSQSASKAEWIALGVLGVLFLLIAFEPDLSMAFVVAVVTMVVMFVGGFSIKRLLLIAFIIGITGLIFTFVERYRVERITSFVDPWGNRSGTGYQSVQALISIGSGGFFGKGLCHGMQKFFYLPAPHTDFVYPVIAEELGLWGCTIVLLGFVVLIGAGMKAAIRSGSIVSAIVGTGMVSIIAIPAIVNLGMATGLLPVVGVPLPFISYSGTGLVVALSGMGILASIARIGDRYADDVLGEVGAFDYNGVEL
ncbi:MAG: hypothetical protein B6D57_03420 [Candidatus Coatesbacteria bacterium 4484_99]|uniref:Probable peptidoglycan glycosyltransferase FtsW n=1 Tax=Candidatus Coatesbacteria bacterium 4484_99 TaxID=1970774 RepID=A0A1W9S0L9_9BACT|nr:MAG: hypothetical protein B6D57_03420 [Candidatus Coatesbacteria bacterium 4484_99]